MVLWTFFSSLMSFLKVGLKLDLRTSSLDMCFSQFSLSIQITSGFLRYLFRIIRITINISTSIINRILFRHLISSIILSIQPMGNECFAKNIKTAYSQYFKKDQIAELKSQWPRIKFLKMKNIFQKKAVTHHTSQLLKFIDFDEFCQIFLHIQSYEQPEKKRIYDIFSLFGESFMNYVDWQSFFSVITVCYFGSEKLISILMFMIFDEDLNKKLKKQELMNLIKANYQFLKVQKAQEAEVQEEQIANLLLGTKKFLSLKQWIEESPIIFNFEQYRKFFAIFKEEVREKQLIKNFNVWNDLYNEEESRYISYVISFKWFQCWKSYVEIEYGEKISMDQKNPKTIKSIKTKKSFYAKSYKTIKSTSVTKYFNERSKQRNIKTKQSFQNIKNIDLVQSHFGDPPNQIENSILQGEFEETLNPGLLENRDYVLVSEKVWNYFKQIYGAYPEFRRTGSDLVELYPKVLRVYFQLYYKQIDYSSVQIRQVSAYLRIDQILAKLQLSQLSQKRVFYRTLQMQKWEQFDDLSEILFQLTPSALIFMVVLDIFKGQTFEKKFLKQTKRIENVVLGDQVLFDNKKITSSKIAIYMGKNGQNKYMLHFKGESHLNDCCFSENQFFKFCTLKLQNSNKKCEGENKLSSLVRGISQIKNYGLITSTIIQFLNNENLISLLQSFMLKDEETLKKAKYLICVLGYISKNLNKNRRVNPNKLNNMIQSFFPQYIDFDITMTQAFIEDFITSISSDFSLNNLSSSFENDYCLQKSLCNSEREIKFDITNNSHSIQLSIPDQNKIFYEIRVVRFSDSLLSSQPIKKYAFWLKQNSKFYDYKRKIQKLTNFQSVNYLIVEIAGSQIVKNLSQVAENANLSDIHLRQEDKIYVFQIYVNYNKFIHNHYSFTQKDNENIRKKDFNLGQLIDCNHQEKGWIIGKVLQKQKSLYPYANGIIVEHHYHPFKSVRMPYPIKEDTIAFFPSRSRLNSKQYHMKLVQRFFHETNNEMKLCNIPLIVSVTDWMRWKQFSFYCYLQLQKFIHPNHRYDYGESKKGGNSFSKFQKYLNGNDCPYKLNLTTFSGRCLICFKFLKVFVEKDEVQKFCPGCQIRQNHPISWQLPIVDVMVFADWKGREFYVQTEEKQDDSYSKMQLEKKKNVDKIERLIQSYFQIDGQRDLSQSLNVSQPILPDNIIVILQRIKNYQGYKQIVSRSIELQKEKIKLRDIDYQLVGVTAINLGTSSSYSFHKFKTYIFHESEGQWVEYDDENTRRVKFQEIKKKCGYVFYYKKVKQKSSQNYIININGVQEEEYFKSTEKDLQFPTVNVTDQFS